MVTLSFTALEIDIEVECDDSDVLRLVQAELGSLRGSHHTPGLRYSIQKRPGCSSASPGAPEGRQLGAVSDPGALLEWLDTELVVSLQRLRRDLYFVHAAVLELSGGAVMLVAPSGVGKSTTAWALLHHAFGYLSDELAPVNLATLEVHPYPRALCLKAEPPPGYPLPETVLRTSRGFHLPAHALPAQVSLAPATIAAIFVLSRQPDTWRPSVRRMTSAEAGARLYANTLNPLAHPGDGLDGAIRIASATPCFELLAADLPATCGLVIDTVAELNQGSGRLHLAPSVL